MKNQIPIAFAIILLVAVSVQSYLLFKLNDKVNRLSGHDVKIDSLDIPKPQFPNLLPVPGDDLSSDQWFPYEEMERMKKTMEKMFEDSFSRFHTKTPLAGIRKTPDVDLRETSDDYIVTVNVPGIDESTLKVNVEDHRLNISVKTEKTTEVSNGGNYRRRERFVGEFNRVLTLPGEVDAAKMKTHYQNGVLTVTIPKK